MPFFSDLLEVALVRELAGNIQSLLDPAAPSTDPSQATTAIFYSISNAQRGLAGVSFGSFLIKRVVEKLAQEFPRLKTFATLSPIPGLTRWIREEGCDLLPSEEKKMKPILGGQPLCDWLGKVLTGVEWLGDTDREKILRPVLLRLAARYVTGAKRESGDALDPVAHFHLSNGARLERLNWAADFSEKGLTQSAGIMANYLYDARKIEANHEAYRGTGRVVMSAAVRGLLKG